jgi:hypothetical protein
VAGEDTVQAWLALPRRVYLDTSTLQTLYGFGDVVFEAEPFVPRGRASRVEGFVDELTALHDIFLVNERARFEFAVTTQACVRSLEMSPASRSGCTRFSTPG